MSGSFASPVVDDTETNDAHTAPPLKPPPPALPEGTSLLRRTWRNLAEFSRMVDEGAGFDTTAGSGTRPPPRSDYPTATAIGQALNKAAGVVGGVTSGLSFGLSDRLNAAMPTEAEQQNQRAQGRFEVTQPGLNTTAQAVGAIAPAVLGDAALARVLPAVTNFNNPLARKAADTATATLRGGAVGAGAGAGMDRNDAVEGALWGGGFGAAVPAGLGLLGLFGRPAVDAVGARLFPSLAQQQAAAKIAQAFNRDMISADEARRALALLGPEGGLIDVGGPNVTGLGETLANMPGQNRKIASDFLEGRMEGAPSRINDAIKAATGSQDDFYTNLSQMVQKRTADARPRYEAAFSRIVTSPEEAARVQRFIADPIGQDALNKGMRIIELEKLAANEKFNMADYGVTRGEGGKFVLGDGVPNLRLMDAVKRGYDEIVEAFRDPVTQKLNLNQYGRAVNMARAAYVSDLRDMYPRYAGALDAWGGPSQAIDALNMGRDVLGNDPEITADIIRRLTPSNREFFLSGVARALKDKVDAAAEGADTTRKIFGNKLIRDKVAAAFDDPAAFDQFRQVMENEHTFATTRNEVLKGSQTARRLAAAPDINYTGPAMLFTAGHPIPAALSVLQQTAKASPAVDTNPVKTQIARALFGQPPNEYFAGLEALQSRQMTPWARVPAGSTATVEAVQPTEEQRRSRAGLLGVQ